MFYEHEWSSHWFLATGTIPQVQTITFFLPSILLVATVTYWLLQITQPIKSYVLIWRYFFYFQNLVDFIGEGAASFLHAVSIYLCSATIWGHASTGPWHFPTCRHATKFADMQTRDPRHFHIKCGHFPLISDKIKLFCDKSVSLKKTFNERPRNPA